MNVSAKVRNPIAPEPRRKVSTLAEAIDPSPHTNGMNAARISSAGMYPLAAKLTLNTIETMIRKMTVRNRDVDQVVDDRAQQHHAGGGRGDHQRLQRSQRLLLLDGADQPSQPHAP